MFRRQRCANSGFLRAEIPYRLVGESSISVPEGQVYSARIHLAGQGLPEMEGQGFELFDESDFGMTAFTQRVNYQRALEAELARTIRHISRVRQARVHLVLPEEALFREEQEQTTASVVLTLEGGANPDGQQIQSIRFSSHRLRPSSSPLRLSSCGAYAGSLGT